MLQHFGKSPHSHPGRRFRALNRTAASPPSLGNSPHNPTAARTRRGSDSSTLVLTCGN